MPNCFNLTRKSAPEAGPVPLNQIDREMCEHFKQPCHPKFWYKGWFDVIGFGLADGKTFGEVWLWLDSVFNTEENTDDLNTYRQICDWLSANFVAQSWVEIGKR